MFLFETNIKSAVPLKLQVNLPLRVYQPFCTNAAYSEEAYWENRSVLQLGRDRLLKQGTVGSQQPPTLWKTIVSTVFVIVFICDIKFGYILAQQWFYVNTFSKFFIGFIFENFHQFHNLLINKYLNKIQKTVDKY